MKATSCVCPGWPKGCMQVYVVIIKQLKVIFIFISINKFLISGKGKLKPCAKMTTAKITGQKLTFQISETQSQPDASQNFPNNFPPNA